ncbi:hypothetical protein KAR91_07895 [Candidatus Pacearchaeota archaeon]|nr:hypothetical protein [Candidatus Pacearchaeota archaeon]
MKYILNTIIITVSLLALAVTIGLSIGWLEHTYPLIAPTQAPQATPTAITTIERITLDDLLDAIRTVETGGEADPDNCYGDGGRALGAYQIHEIYVRDANRILGWYRFRYEDRRDRKKSREMTSIVIQHYGKGDIETMARTHKCPPERYKDSTLPYWEKVKVVLK